MEITCMRIVASSSYIPKRKVMNKEIADKFNLKEEYIVKRTGIKQRYYVEDETIEEMATLATKKLIEKSN